MIKKLVNWVRGLGEVERLVSFVGVALALFLVALTIGQVVSWYYNHEDHTEYATISVAGHGETRQVPDVATFTFSAVSEKTTVAAAQKESGKINDDAIAFLKQGGVADKDLQTSGYSIQPQYDYRSCGMNDTSCVNGQVLRGYRVSQSTSVKVRDLTKAGDLLAGVGQFGVTELSGLTFTIDKPDTAQNSARAEAIEKAKVQAKEIAKSLGVHLDELVGFYESTSGTGGGVTPMYAKSMMMDSASYNQSARVTSTVASGENLITSDVTLTYRVK